MPYLLQKDSKPTSNVDDLLQRAQEGGEAVAVIERDNWKAIDKRIPHCRAREANRKRRKWSVRGIPHKAVQLTDRWRVRPLATSTGCMLQAMSVEFPVRRDVGGGNGSRDVRGVVH